MSGKEVPVVERKFTMEVYSRFGNVLTVEYDPWYRHYTGTRLGRIEILDESGRFIHSSRTFEQATEDWEPNSTEWLDGTWQGQNALSAVMVNGIVVWLKAITEWAFKSEQ